MIGFCLSAVLSSAAASFISSGGESMVGSSAKVGTLPHCRKHEQTEDKYGRHNLNNKKFWRHYSRSLPSTFSNAMGMARSSTGGPSARGLGYVDISSVSG